MSLRLCCNIWFLHKAINSITEFIGIKLTFILWSVKCINTCLKDCFLTSWKFVYLQMLSDHYWILFVIFVRPAISDLHVAWYMLLNLGKCKGHFWSCFLSFFLQCWIIAFSYSAVFSITENANKTCWLLVQDICCR